MICVASSSSDFGVGDYDLLSAASDVDGSISSNCFSSTSVGSLSSGVNDDRGSNGSSGKISDDKDGNGCGAREHLGEMSDGTTLVDVEKTALEKIELKLSWAVCEDGTIVVKS